MEYHQIILRYHQTDIELPFIALSLSLSVQPIRFLIRFHTIFTLQSTCLRPVGAMDRVRPPDRCPRAVYTRRTVRVSFTFTQSVAVSFS